MLSTIIEGLRVRYIIFLLLAVTVGLGVLASQQAATIKEQQGQLVTASDRGKAESLTMQGKCSDQARKVFTSLGYRDGGMNSFQNHYQTKLNKCMLLLETKNVSGGTVYTFKFVIDAFENKNYGEYTWRTDPVKKYWEVPPVSCNVYTISGEKKNCTSEDEFVKLASEYMEG